LYEPPVYKPLYRWDWITEKYIYIGDNAKGKKGKKENNVVSHQRLQAGDDKNELTKQMFCFGQSIKCRTGIVRGSGKGQFLEGDILINQHLDFSHALFPTDYENRYRIKIFGKEKELMAAVNRDRVEVKVEKAKTKGGLTVYICQQPKITSWVSQKVLNLLPSPTVPLLRGNQVPMPSGTICKCDKCKQSKSIDYDCVEDINTGEIVCYDCLDAEDAMAAITELAEAQKYLQ